MAIEHATDLQASQDRRYRSTVEALGPDIARFGGGYEHDAAKRQERLQEVHVALWQSFAGFNGRCSLRTWVYRVAHNVGVTHVQRSRRVLEEAGLDLDGVDSVADEKVDIAIIDRRLDLERLLVLIHRLAPLAGQRLRAGILQT